MSEKIDFISQRTVSSAFIDSSVHMGIAQSVLMIQDNLTECFNKMNCDGVYYKEKFNVFWVFTKTKVHFYRRPNWREKITARTFPVDNAGFKVHVNTELKDEAGNVLITANQEACVLDFEKHRPVKISTLPYPTENFHESIFDEPFEKIFSDFTDKDFRYEQKILSQHIDMSNHLNNIEYIKFALNVFDNNFLLTHQVKSLEVHYTGESTENQLLRIYSRTEGSTTYIGIKAENRQVFEMKISFYD